MIEQICNLIKAHQTLSAAVIIGVSGAFGGFVYGISARTSYNFRIPFSEKSVELGFLGDVLTGIAASYGVFFLVDSFVGDNGVNVENLHEILRVVSLSLLSGFAGITLLKKVSAEMLDKLSKQTEKLSKQTQQISEKLEENFKVLRMKDLESQAEFFLREKKFEQAIMACEEMLKNDPHSDLGLILKAKALRLAGALAEAKKLLDTVIGRDAKNARAYYNRACYRFLLKEPKEAALEDLRKAVELRPAYKKYAVEDSDFKDLKTDTDFLKIIS